MSNVIEKAVVLSVRKYNLTDESTGQVVSGVTCLYVPHMNPYSDDVSKGTVPIKFGFRDMSMFNKFPQVPGVYNLSYDLIAGAGGKPTLLYTDVEYVGKKE